jgi:hypothetical protein
VGEGTPSTLAWPLNLSHLGVWVELSSPAWLVVKWSCVITML